jgi:hypothetical protein
VRTLDAFPPSERNQQLAHLQSLPLTPGIPVLLEAYLAFRQKLRSLDPQPTPEQTPQLVIAGHGSVDDVRWPPSLVALKVGLVGC